MSKETTSLQKNSAQAVSKPSALNLMASRLSVEPTKLFDTLKATVFAKATNEELLALVVVSNEYQLNPFLKEIYAFPAKGGGIVPIISVDGWNKMLTRHPDFDGIEFEFIESSDGAEAPPIACTATIYVKNRAHPVKITEYLSECKRNTEPWNNMPRRMLRNRTLCQASRVAFGFSGVLAEGEAIDVTATVVPNTPPPKLIAPAEGKNPQDELESVIVTAGFTITDFQKWATTTGNVENADSLATFAEVPIDVARRLLRNQAGLIDGLTKGKQ